jgi:hypothetical protein
VVTLCLVLSLPLLFHAPAVLAFAPHQGDTFSYYEVTDLGNGIGAYAGYAEHMVVNGTEVMNGVGANGTVSASYGSSWTWDNSSGTTKTGSQSGNYTFSSTSFLYLHGTDNQTGYVNPTVWFAMDSSLPIGGTFYDLNTQMTVMSKNYSYFLPSLDKNVTVIFAQGISNYLRNDVYGTFTATYTWDSYFDPSTGYIVGYSYVEHDTNSSGDGFTYTDSLYVTSASYPLTTAAGGGLATVGTKGTTTAVATSLTQSTSSSGATTGPASNNYLGYVAGLVIVAIVLAILVYALSRRGRRSDLPRHSQGPSSGPPPSRIDLTPAEQPPVQQVVIKEVAKVQCAYCGAWYDTTAQVCPRCGAARR